MLIPAGHTSVGSMPGTDPAEASRIVVGESAAWPHLPELPGRGLGADLVGRCSPLLVDMLLDTSPRAYRLATRPTRVARLARDLLARDVDAFEEAWETAGHRRAGVGPSAPGPTAAADLTAAATATLPVTVQACGPYTLAALVELGNGHKVLRDPGATRDLADSLAEGVARHAAEVAARCGTRVMVQFDEPLLGEVVAGEIPGVSRLDPLRAVPAVEAAVGLRRVVEAVRAGGVDAVMVHTCAASPPWEVLGGAGLDALGIDATLVQAPADLDGLGELVGSGLPVVLGVLPAVPPPRSGAHSRGPAPRDLALTVTGLLDTLGLPRHLAVETLALAPTCGMAAAPAAWPVRALALCREAAEILARDAGDL